MELSQLHMHSWGLVTQVKERNTKMIKVVPFEFRFGDIEAVMANYDAEELEFAGQTQNDAIKVIRSDSIDAKWLPMDTNQWTAPDVRRNSLVVIYRYGDTDQYYWRSSPMDNVKRLETVVTAYSADPNNPTDTESFSNAYVKVVSTHDKHITLQTSQANGEPFGYTIQLDTGTGKAQILDTANNTIYLDSANTVIGLQNACTTEFRLDKLNIHAFAPDSMYFKAVRDVEFICTNFRLLASASITFNTTVWTANASASIAFNTKMTNLVSTDSITVMTNILSMTATTSVTMQTMAMDITATNLMNVKSKEFVVTAPNSRFSGMLYCNGIQAGSKDSSSGGAMIYNQATFLNGLIVKNGLTVDEIICSGTVQASNGSFSNIPY